jgi:hypothetical protein
MPLEDLEVIDLVLAPDENGRVGLVITDSGVTTDAARRTQLFKEKARGYVSAVVSGLFKKQHPSLKTSDFFIKVVSATPPTVEMYEWYQVGSRSRPEHTMSVVFEQFNGRLWPGQKFARSEDLSRIPPPGDELRDFAQRQIEFGFETIRDKCFLPFAAWTEAGEDQIACLAFEGEAILLAAQDIASKASPQVSRFVILYDAFITGAGGVRQDALMARVSERGRPRGFLIEQKYTPPGFLKKAKKIGGAEIVDECENDLEPG